jgi:small neutral amino acid transporter SnatA (MarC family)
VSVGLTTFDASVAVDLLLLLLIGIGPKIALVPYLDATAALDDATKARVTRKMLTTAAVISFVLVVFGEILTRLLHISTGALTIAGGIVLFAIAVSMIRGPADASSPNVHAPPPDPMRLAMFPLAVPYLVNPAGFVVLVTASGDAGSVGHLGAVIGLVALVLVFDVVVFRLANRLSAHLDEGRMLVTEKVFGLLLAALGVQLVLNGLDVLGVIHLTSH